MAEHENGHPPAQVTLFYTKESPFSNFHRAAFEWRPADCPAVAARLLPGFRCDAFAYNCSEQAMMHAKALFFGDYFVSGQILAAQTPNSQKRLGRAVKNFEADAWAAASAEIVEDILMAKFAQNPGLLRQLLATGETVMAEASPKDRIWGIGLGAADPRARDPGQWLGENRLGRVLMRVRGRLGAQ